MNRKISIQTYYPLRSITINISSLSCPDAKARQEKPACNKRVGKGFADDGGRPTGVHLIVFSAVSVLIGEPTVQQRASVAVGY